MGCRFAERNEEVAGSGWIYGLSFRRAKRRSCRGSVDLWAVVSPSETKKLQGQCGSMGCRFAERNVERYGNTGSTKAANANKPI